MFAGNFLMTTEVIVCTVSDAPKLAPSEREQELDVCCALAVEGKFGLVMITEAKLVFLESEGEQPFLCKCFPVLKPLEIRIRLAEELKFHLFELSCTECEIARSDLVTEGLADLADAERKFLS